MSESVKKGQVIGYSAVSWYGPIPNDPAGWYLDDLLDNRVLTLSEARREVLDHRGLPRHRPLLVKVVAMEDAVDGEPKEMI